MERQARLRAVLYARVSSAVQAGEDRTSLDSQMEACRQLAEQQGWEVVAELRDDSTGYNLDRAGLDEVRRLIREDEAEVVVAHKQERISRSQEGTQVLYGEFARAGARIWTVQEGSFDDSPIGRHIVATYALVAELDRANRREATMRGAREKAKAGKIFGSAPRPPYGYGWVYEEKPNGKRTKVAYVVNEPEAEVVRWLFAETLRGRTPSQLADDLNERGVPTAYAGDTRYPTKGRWSHSGIRKVLRHEVYTGEAWALVHKRKTPGGTIVEDRSNGVKLPEGVVPALVSRDEFDRVQFVLDERHFRPTGFAANSDVWVRGGIAKCGNCGSNLILTRVRGKEPYLKCSRAGRDSDRCGKPSPQIHARKLEEAAWAVMRRSLLDPSFLFDRYTSPEQTETEERLLADLTGRLEAVERRRSRLLRSLEFLDDADLADVKERLGDLAGERDALREQLGKVQSRIGSRDAERSHVERLVRWLESEQRRVDDLTPEERRAAALELGLTVTLYPRGAAERYVVNIGPDEDAFWQGIDWSTVEEPTEAQRREVARLQEEAQLRDRGAGLIGALMTHSADEEYFTTYIRETYLFTQRW